MISKLFCNLRINSIYFVTRQIFRRINYMIIYNVFLVMYGVPLLLMYDRFAVAFMQRESKVERKEATKLSVSSYYLLRSDREKIVGDINYNYYDYHLMIN